MDLCRAPVSDVYPAFSVGHDAVGREDPVGIVLAGNEFPYPGKEAFFHTEIFGSNDGPEVADARLFRRKGPDPCGISLLRLPAGTKGDISGKNSEQGKQAKSYDGPEVSHSEHKDL